MKTQAPTCETHEHDQKDRAVSVDPVACRRAAEIFRALGDPVRLRMLSMLMQDELCVTEIAAALDDNLSAVSQRLKLLRSERIVTYRREGKHVFYALADEHISELVSNALAHATEPEVALRGGRTS